MACMDACVWLLASGVTELPVYVVAFVARSQRLSTSFLPSVVTISAIMSCRYDFTVTNWNIEEEDAEAVVNKPGFPDLVLVRKVKTGTDLVVWIFANAWSICS